MEDKNSNKFMKIDGAVRRQRTLRYVNDAIRRWADFRDGGDPHPNGLFERTSD